MNADEGAWRRESCGRPPHRFHPHEGCVLALLALAGLAWAWRVPRVVDLSVTDEAFYLQSGLRLWQAGPPPPEWAPLYAGWYFLLSRVAPDPVALYDLSFALLTTTVPLLLYWILRRSGVPALFAGVVACAYLGSAANLDAWPYPGRLASLLLLLGLLAADRWPHERWLVLAVTLLAVSYVRPEYFVALGALLAGCATVAIWRRRRAEGVRLGALRGWLLFAAGSLGLVAALGPPIGSGPRSERAFAQHFARSWAERHARPIRWTTEYDVAMREAFGDATTPLAALRASPRHFFEHVAANATRYGRNLADAVGMRASRYRGRVPAAIGASPALAATLAVVAVLAALGALAERRRRAVRALAMAGEPGQPAARKESLHTLLVCLGLVSLAVLPSALLIFPRPHYLQLQALLATIVLIRVATWIGRRVRAWIGIARAGAVLDAAGAVAALGAMALWGAALGPAPADAERVLPFRRTVELLRPLGRDEALTLLAPVAGPHYDVFLGERARAVHRMRRERRGEFDAFLVRSGIDVIVDPDGFAKFDSFRDDASFERVVREPLAFGFIELAVPGAPSVRVLARQRVLQGAGVDTSSGRRPE
jgi:hypothetical protein